MSRLELKMPPVVVWLAIGLLMWLGSRFVPIFVIGWPQRPVMAMAVAAIGVVIAVLGVGAFRRAKTTVNPLHPERMSVLVVTGIYRATRNPMYLGMLLALMGWAIWLGTITAWFFLPGFIAYMNRFQIEPEERALTAKFGTNFAEYCARVRRWY